MKNRLRVRRAELRMTQMDAGRAAGITQTRFWRIENEYADPTPAERVALARVLDTTEEALFPDVDVAQPSEVAR